MSTHTSKDYINTFVKTYSVFANYVSRYYSMYQLHKDWYSRLMPNPSLYLEDNFTLRTQKPGILGKVILQLAALFYRGSTRFLNQSPMTWSQHQILVCLQCIPCHSRYVGPLNTGAKPVSLGTTGVLVLALALGTKFWSA